MYLVTVERILDGLVFSWEVEYEALDKIISDPQYHILGVTSL